MNKQLFKIVFPQKRRVNKTTIHKSLQKKQYTVKPDHAVTFIKQLLVLKGHFFLVLSWNIS